MKYDTLKSLQVKYEEKQIYFISWDGNVQCFWIENQQDLFYDAKWGYFEIIRIP